MENVFSLKEYEKYFDLEKRYPEFFSLTEGVSIVSSSGKIPLLSFNLSNKKKIAAEAPTLGLFAGVHGIEAIGVKILYCFIDHLLEQTTWNSELRELLSKVKIIGIPIVNPVGFQKGTRCNVNGVDLMRNAPVLSSHAVPFLGGQALSRFLPYFMGHGYFEMENVHLMDLVRNELWTSPFSVAVDIHSGFGATDFLWTPWAREKGVPPCWTLYSRFFRLLDSTLKNHVYKCETQSASYCSHGDLWDFLLAEHLKLFWPNTGMEREFDDEKSGGLEDCQLPVTNYFLPFTLEVGSWAWLRKNPSAALKLRGLFNPTLPHRERRVLRRHLPLLNLLLSAVCNFRSAFLGKQVIES